MLVYQRVPVLFDSAQVVVSRNLAIFKADTKGRQIFLAKELPFALRCLMSIALFI